MEIGRLVVHASSKQFSRCRVVAAMIGCSVVAVLSGCATVTDGSTQRVHVESTPPGARVVVNGQVRGTTPTVVALKRWNTSSLRLELDGYEPYEVQLVKRWNDTATGNAVLLGYSLPIDAISGALWELQLSNADQRRAEAEGWEARRYDPLADTSPRELFIAPRLHPLPQRRSW